MNSDVQSLVIIGLQLVDIYGEKLELLPNIDTRRAGP
jgi:hypothetical protein